MILPEALRPTERKPCWVNFSKSKIPLNPRTLHNASSTNSRTWSDFQTAAANIGKTASIRAEKIEKDEEILGVGLILGEPSGLNGVDLDHVIDDQGQIDAAAAEILRKMNSYAELSPSGTGIHILFSGDCPVTSCKVTADGKSREMYSERRYFTFTGAIIGSYDKIRDRTEEVREVYKDHFQPFQSQPQPKQRRSGKKKSVILTGNEAIDAIKKHDSEYFKKTLKEKKHTFNNRESFFQYLYQYPLDRFLGVEAGTAFCCFFHDDNNPSASVFQSGAETGKKWLYHCHSENMTLTIKTLVEKAGDFQSEPEALDFLKDCLNLTILDNKWSRQQQETIDLILDKLLTTDEQSFSVLCPTAAGNVRFGLSLYMQILILAKSSIYPSKHIRDGDVLFYMSLDQITKAAKRSSKDKTLRWIKTLQYHALLKAVPDEEIPRDLLQKARRQAENQYRHVSFYKIPSMVYQKLELVERQGKRWKQNRYTLKGVSYEMFMRSEGKEVADSLYPQRLSESVGSIATVGAKANAKAEARHEQIHEVAVDLLDRQGYFTESQVAEVCGMGKYWGTTQIKRSLTDICNMYGIVRKKAGKALKQRFSINSEGYPIIYYQQ